MKMKILRKHVGKLQLIKIIFIILMWGDLAAIALTYLTIPILKHP